MRKFGNDAPEFMSFTLGHTGKKVYKMPLAASMPMTIAVRFSEIAALPEDQQGVESIKFQLEVLRRYVGDAADDLTASQVAEIFEAWGEESSEQGASLGE